MAEPEQMMKVGNYRDKGCVEYMVLFWGDKDQNPIGYFGGTYFPPLRPVEERMEKGFYDYDHTCEHCENDEWAQKAKELHLARMKAEADAFMFRQEFGKMIGDALRENRTPEQQKELDEIKWFKES